MKIKTKTYLTESQIKTLYYHHFDKAHVINQILPLSQGMFNNAYRINYDDHESTILKISVHPEAKLLTYEKDPMRTELAVYDLLKDKGIPLPNIMARNTHRDLIPNDYFFMSVAEGETVQNLQQALSESDYQDIDEQLGTYFGILHQMKGSYYGYFTDDPTYQFKTWKEAFSHMYQMILSDAKRLKLKLPFVRINKALHKIMPLLDDVKEPVLVDYDLWAGNIFVKKVSDKYQITCLVDFERSFYGDPIADFAGANFFVKDMRDKPRLLSAYYKSVNDGKTYTDRENMKFQLYRLYLIIIMYTETYRYPRSYAPIQRKFSKDVMNECLHTIGIK